jgi:beta-lactamase class D
LLALLAFYAIDRKMWWLAASMALIAGATRPTGVFVGVCVIAAYALDWYQTKHPLRRDVAWLALVPLGTLAYLVYNYFQWGDFFAPMHVSEANWRRGALRWDGLEQGLYLITHPDAWLNGTDYKPLLFGLYCVLALLFLISLPFIWRKLGPIYTLYAVLAIFVPIITDDVMVSVGRYLSVVFPIARGISPIAVFFLVIALDPGNGEVLAFTSVPSYDPNAFAAGIDRATWASLNTDDLKPLQDRAIQGRYPPGSTFKMAVGTAALEEGVITPDFKVFCPGHATFFGRSFQCSLPNGRGHGTIDLRQAIEKSCNVYFYTVGNMVGIDKIHKWATLLGLGERTGIDLPNEQQGLVPSPEWKRQRFHEKWYAGETISVSIGQGAVALTPVSMAVYISTLANGGTRLTPHLLKAVDDGTGWKDVPPPAPRSTVQLKPETIQAIRDGLWMVVNASGTGGKARIAGRDVSGKTGTAQVISLEGSKAAKGRSNRDLRDNGWFVFFAPRDHPQIAGVVFVEHGGHGGTTAAPIARHVLETFFAKQDGLSLPVLKELVTTPVDGEEPVAPPTAVATPR